MTNHLGTKAVARAMTHFTPAVNMGLHPSN